MALRRRTVLSGLAASAAAPLLSVGAEARGKLTTRYGYNDSQISWRLFGPGAREAKATGKPIFFLVHATWCHHCLSYRKLFFDKDVVIKMRRFIPVLVDADRQPDVNKRYAPTGAYVPRTMFLNAEAKLQPQLHLPYPEFEYFVDYLDGPKDLRRLLAKAERQFF